LIVRPENVRKRKISKVDLCFQGVARGGGLHERKMAEPIEFSRPFRQGHPRAAELTRHAAEHLEVSRGSG
jgi:hypothetical protein